MQDQQVKGSKRRIKGYLINPKYQMRYVLWIVGTGVILTFLNSSIYYHYIRENYALLVDLSPMTEDARKQLYAELNHITFLLRVTSLAFIVLIGFWAIYLTHKTAGPLYHFKRVFNEIKKGNKDARIHLRPSDDFKDVANSFNEMMDVVSKK